VRSAVRAGRDWRVASRAAVYSREAAEVGRQGRGVDGAEGVHAEGELSKKAEKREMVAKVPRARRAGGGWRWMLWFAQQSGKKGNEEKVR
jgi:hypothetical protein